MIKKFFEFAGDVFLMLVFLGILLVPVFAVFSLSPLNAENLGYTNEADSNVLGVQSSEKKLIISPFNESNGYFIVESENFVNLKQNIKVGPMNAEKFKKRIFRIENPHDSVRSFKVVMKIPEDYKSLANIGVEYLDDEYILLDSNGTENILNGNIQPNSTADFYFLIDPTSRINYQIETEILVEETLQQFEYPE